MSRISPLSSCSSLTCYEQINSGTFETQLFVVQEDNVSCLGVFTRGGRNVTLHAHHCDIIFFFLLGNRTASTQKPR